MIQPPESFALQPRLYGQGVAPIQHVHIGHMITQEYATDA